jgi:hypothetical protein
MPQEIHKHAEPPPPRQPIHRGRLYPHDGEAFARVSSKGADPAAAPRRRDDRVTSRLRHPPAGSPSTGLRAPCSRRGHRRPARYPGRGRHRAGSLRSTTRGTSPSPHACPLMGDRVALTAWGGESTTSRHTVAGVADCRVPRRWALARLSVERENPPLHQVSNRVKCLQPGQPARVHHGFQSGGDVDERQEHPTAVV